jgi:membrane protease YdiL (CAAX protease family)
MSIAIAIAAFIALGIAASIGVFSPRRINGPQRLAPDQPPTVLFGIACLGLLAWAMTNIVFVSLPGNQINGTTRPESYSEPLGVAFGILADLIALAALLGATRIVLPNGLEQLGIAWNRLPKGLAGGILGIIIVLPLVLYAENATEFLWDHLHLQTPSAHKLLQIFQEKKSSTGLRAMIIVSATLVAPVAEEVFFRGFVQTFLRYTFKRPWLAVVVTAAFFALVHEWWEAPPIFFLAVCLGYAYERTGNLWISIIIHALFNSASIVLFWQFEMGK